MVPSEDFGEYLVAGGQARFTEIDGGDRTIINLPLQVDAGVTFEIEIGSHAIGGQMIIVAGLQVRARAPGRTCTGTSDEDDDDDDESEVGLDEPGPWLPTGSFGGDGGAGGSVGVVA